MSQLLFETLARVRTYKITQWSYQSPKIFHPYSLAIQGYSCVSQDTLQCHICKNVVKFNEEQDNESQQDHENIIKKLKEHHSGCIYYNLDIDNKQVYKSLMSQGNLYLHMDEISQKLKKTYNKKAPSYHSQKNPTASTTQKQHPLPVINNKNLWQLIQTKWKSDMMKTVMKRCQMQQKNYQISFILRLFGWALKNHHQNNTQHLQLECVFCGGTADINQYKKVLNDKQPSELPPSQKDKPQFDPTQQHRYFCIWNYQVNGWQIWLQHLWDKMGEAQQLFRKKNPQAIKKIRLNLDKYLQTFSATTKQQFDKINKILNQCKDIACALQGSNIEEINQKYKRNREQFSDFLEVIDEGIRMPLKKLKLE